jgi:hypothetical protein
MTFRDGSAVGPYEIRERVGAGGMGEVYRAIDSRLNRTVAIKVIPAAAAGDPARRERFRREARTISSLNQPHICTIYDNVQKGMLDAALTELRQSPAPPGPFLSVFGYVSALKGDRTSAHRVIADLEALSKHRYIPRYAFATVYVGLGMRDEAFAQLRRGCLEHSAYLDYLTVEPHLDPLRTDPRFADLLRCVRRSVDVSPVKVAVRAHPAS